MSKGTFRIKLQSILKSCFRDLFLFFFAGILSKHAYRLYKKGQKIIKIIPKIKDILSRRNSIIHPCLITTCLVLSSFNEVNYSSVDSNNIPFDRKIAERFGFKNGIFIEVGANDGIIQSNTKLLEEFYDWSGILIEPSPILYNRLVSNRPSSKCIQCALGSPEQDNTYLYGDFDGALMSSIDGTRRNRPATQRILVRTLQSILDEVQLRHIHFFSLDVEGYELNVLKGIDFSKSSFDYILIEIYNSFYNEIIEFLQLKGYEMIENFSNYKKTTNPDWDGTHDDYLFQPCRTKNDTSILKIDQNNLYNRRSLSSWTVS